jgi:hypothetical protein
MWMYSIQSQWEKTNVFIYVIIKGWSDYKAESNVTYDLHLPIPFWYKYGLDINFTVIFAHMSTSFSSSCTNIYWYVHEQLAFINGCHHTLLIESLWNKPVCEKENWFGLEYCNTHTELDGRRLKHFQCHPSKRQTVPPNVCWILFLIIQKCSFFTDHINVSCGWTLVWRFEIL